jgi:hypothetical protein
VQAVFAGFGNDLILSLSPRHGDHFFGDRSGIGRFDGQSILTSRQRRNS